MGQSSDGALGVPGVEPDAQVEDGTETPASGDADSDAEWLLVKSDRAAVESSDVSVGAVSDDPAEVSAAPTDTSAELPIGDLVAAVGRMERQLETFHARAENYEQIIREMQSRIEKLQGDQVQALLKPVIQRLAGLHAQAVEAGDRAHDRGELAEKDLSFFAVAIEEAFGLMDIESVGASASELFDSSKHHAARIVPSDDPDLDKRIERVLRQGFTYAGAPRVFLPAHVSVFRYQPPPPVEADELVAEEDSQPQLETGEGASNE